MIATTQPSSLLLARRRGSNQNDAHQLGFKSDFGHLNHKSLTPHPQSKHPSNSPAPLQQRSHTHTRILTPPSSPCAFLEVNHAYSQLTRVLERETCRKKPSTSIKRHASHNQQSPLHIATQLEHVTRPHPNTNSHPCRRTRAAHVQLAPPGTQGHAQLPRTKI